MDRWDWIVLWVLLGIVLILAAIWLWKWWQDNKIEPPKTITIHDIDAISGVGNDRARSRKLSQEQYVRNLDKVIEDVERMADSLTEGEERDLWFLYVQELRVRQLKVIQGVQDKEWRKVRGDTLTREEMRAVEEVALREMRRLEKELGL